MTTLEDYIECVSTVEQHRHRPERWVAWANALLEKLSGAGVLPPQHLTRGVVVRDGVWVDRPPNCRDVKELRDNGTQRTNYRFAEENNCLRLLDVSFNKAEEHSAGVISGGSRTHVYTRLPGLAENYLKDWLFVVTAGKGIGSTFIVSNNQEAIPPGNWASAYFLNPPRNSPYIEEGFIENGYFVSPRDYLILSFVAAFEPVVSMSDNLGIDGRYDNLVEAWFRWKCEEQAQSMSQDCMYWGNKFIDELAQLRAEMLNRINKPQGRQLAGFMGGRR